MLLTTGNDNDMQTGDTRREDYAYNSSADSRFGWLKVDERAKGTSRAERGGRRLKEDERRRSAKGRNVRGWGERKLHRWRENERRGEMSVGGRTLQEKREKVRREEG